MRYLTALQVDDICRRAWNGLTLCCCEFHAHSVEAGCYMGEDSDKHLVMLCNELARVRSQIPAVLEGRRP